MDLGVYIVNFINVLIIAPPLITTEKEIDEGMQALDKVLEIADKEAK
jgi:taurine--2-oxoglutarate transaminase